MQLLPILFGLNCNNRRLFSSITWKSKKSNLLNVYVFTFKTAFSITKEDWQNNSMYALSLRIVIVSKMYDQHDCFQHNNSPCISLEEILK